MLSRVQIPCCRLRSKPQGQSATSNKVRAESSLESGGRRVVTATRGNKESKCSERHGAELCEMP